MPPRRAERPNARTGLWRRPVASTSAEVEVGVLNESMQPDGLSASFVPPDQPADISIIVVNYNTAHLLERCIGNLRVAASGMRVQLIVVDNASRDDSARLIERRFPDVWLIRNAVNVGFGRANNQALEFCSAPFVLLLNADAFVLPDTLRLSRDHLAMSPKCGVLGVKLIDEAGRSGYCGREFPTSWDSFALATGLMRPQLLGETVEQPDVKDCDWVVGCYYMVRREVIDTVGLFDPRYFLYMEEVDHCRAVKAAGWRVECLMGASVIHVGGGSAESEGPLSTGRQISSLQTESTLLYYRKHNGVLGLFVCVALSLLATAIVAAKDLLKRRPLACLRSHASHAGTVLRLLVATRAGQRPTR